MNGCKPLSAAMAEKKIAETIVFSYSNPTYYHSLAGGVQYLTIGQPGNDSDLYFN